MHKHTHIHTLGRVSSAKKFLFIEKGVVIGWVGASIWKEEERDKTKGWGKWSHFENDRKETYYVPHLTINMQTGIVMLMLQIDIGKQDVKN